MQSDTVTYRLFPYILSFLILSFFATFTGVGTDRAGYIYYFGKTHLGDGNPWALEIGYRVMMDIVNIVISDGKVFVGIISFITVLFMYVGIWKCRDFISLPTAIFIYAAQYYFQSFNIMRMYLAMSIMVLGAHCLFEKKYKKYFVYLIVATSIHYACFFALGTYIVAMVFKNKSLSRKAKVIILFLIAIIGMRFSSILMFMLSNSALTGGKYLNYTSSLLTGGIGLKIILNIIPFVLTLVILRNSTRDESDFYYIELVFFVVYLIVNVASYSVPVVGRALNTLLIPIQIIYPYTLRLMKERMIYNNYYVPIFRIKFTYRMIMCITVLSIILNFYLYLSGYLLTDGISTYKFIWSI